MARQQFIVDVADTFKTYVYENNRKIVPSSATITVYQPGTTTVLIATVAMTVAGDGLLSYSLTAAHNDIADENYKTVVAYVVGGTTYYLTLYYDVVNSKLHQVITDADIVNELPQLKDKGWRVHGTVDSGSTITIVDAELTRYEDDYFTGGLATNLTHNETREITDFVSSTGTLTTSIFATANAAADKYVLARSYTKEIQRAFEKIEGLLNSAGQRAHLILDPYDLREVHIYYAVAEACKGMATESENFWWALWQEYDKKGWLTFKGLKLKYDTSNDGVISSADEDKKLVQQRTLGRG